MPRCPSEFTALTRAAPDRRYWSIFRTADIYYFSLLRNVGLDMRSSSSRNFFVALTHKNHAKTTMAP